MRKSLKAAFAVVLSLCFVFAAMPISAMTNFGLMTEMTEVETSLPMQSGYSSKPDSGINSEIISDPINSALHTDGKVRFSSGELKSTSATRYTVLVLDTADEATFLNSNDEVLYVAGTAIEYVKRASSRFISCLSEASGNNYLAVVSYSQYASLVSGFSQDFDHIDALIQQLTASTGLRNMASALDTAYSLLAAVDDSSAIKNVVLFSTGMVNEGQYNYSGEFDENTVGSHWHRTDNGIHLYAYANYALERAAIIKNAGMYLYSIGLFQSFDGMPEEGHDVAALFQLTASALATSDEYYYPTDNPDELEIIFEEVFNDIFQVFVQYVLSPGNDDEQKKGWFTIKFDDNWFTRSATEFNYDLAKASLAAAAGSFSEKIANNPLAEHTGDYYVKENLKGFGFGEDSIKTFKFDDNTSIGNTCGHAFAIKELPNGDYLIAAAIRSSGYGTEWESNFNAVSEDNNYQFTLGFKEAADEVYMHLNDYINQQCTELGIGRDKIHIWTFGFSRGGAIAGLLAARLNEQSDIPQAQIAAYTFEAPKNVLKSARVKYGNIYNILQETDIVPHVPLRTWGYTWYGNNYYLPSRTRTGRAFYDKKRAMRACFNDIMKYSGRENIHYALGSSQELSLDLLLDYLDDVIRTRYGYRDYGWQDIARSFGIQMGEAGDFDLGTLLNLLIPHNEVFVEHFCSLLDSWNSLGFFEKVSELKQLLHELSRVTAGGGTSAAEQTVSMLKNGLSHFCGRLIQNANPFDDNRYTDDYERMFEMICDTVKNGMYGELFMQHWPETIMAWLNSANDETLFERESYTRVSLKCPIDVYVYDSSNNLVGRIVDDIVDESIEESVFCSSDMLGEKTVFLPDDDSYRIEIVAREAGDFDMINDYYSEERDLDAVECYIDISMTEGQRFIAEYAQNEQKCILSTSGVEMVPDYFTEANEEIPEFYVKVNCEGLGSVGGEGYYTLGQTVTLAAVELYGSTFAGWYNAQNELISTELVYSYSITSDGVFTGVFFGGNETDPEPVTPSPNEPTPIPDPGDTTPMPDDSTPMPDPGDTTPEPNDPHPTAAPTPPSPNTGAMSIVGIGVSAVIGGICIIKTRKRNDN